MNARMYSVGLSLVLLATSHVGAQEEEGEANPEGAESGPVEAASDDAAGADVLSAPRTQAVFDYEAPSPCPSRAEFVAMVQALSPELDLEADEAQLRAIVRIVRSRAGFTGSFALEGQAPATQAREVESPSCSEVASALSVVSVIALDPADDPTLVEPLPPAEVEPSPDPQIQEEEPPVKHSVAGRSKRARPLHDDLLKTNASLARKPRWARNMRLSRSTQLDEGELSIRRIFSFDAQTGVTLGHFPGKPVARFDISARTGVLMRTPEDEAFLVGFMPRLRFTTLPVARYNVGDIQNTVRDTYLVSLGGCYSPYFNPQGFALLGCADYGGGVMTQEPALLDDVPPSDDAPTAVPLDVRGVNRVALTLDAEYNLLSVFHLAARVGLESHLTGRLDLYEAPGTLSGRTGWVLGVATAGVGAHF